ncbi:MAG: hypothetical protein H6720_17425 [Sandaracinus sp.]|nr:hypothetical protein [Sandaracinus sp.]
MKVVDVPVFARAMVRALRDSNATLDLLTGEEISSADRMSALVPLMHSTEEGRTLLRERPRLGSAALPALRRLPEGTLGRTYVDHLDRCGLDPDALDVPVTRAASDEANYVLTRIRDTHDLWHALLGLGVAGHEEVLVHTFQWPQLRMPYSALVVFFGGLKHVLGERRVDVWRRGLRAAHAAGVAAAPLLPVFWEKHFDEPLASVRARFGIRPASTWGLDEGTVFA